LGKIFPSRSDDTFCGESAASGAGQPTPGTNDDPFAQKRRCTLKMTHLTTTNWTTSVNLTECQYFGGPGEEDEIGDDFFLDGAGDDETNMTFVMPPNEGFDESAAYHPAADEFDDLPPE
jgi:hypothetical protein